MNTLRNEFANPPAAYRGAPFWSWNDRLDPAEIARQVRDMKAHGMGGFFMHSRDGLETVYMGPEWLACIREAVRAAREEGMNAWLYDEDRWPSGAAGGLVPARGGDAFRQKVLTCERADRPPEHLDDVLVLYVGRLEGDTLVDPRRAAPESPPPLGEGQAYFIFRREVSGPLEWFNDDAYADNLNPEAVAAFIDITYEAYAREVGDEFGKAVPGVFTDEPNIFAAEVRSGRPALPWTDGLPAFFQERRGYDLLDALPWLFYEGLGAARSRHDYWYTVTERFVEAYSRQAGEWCEAHGLAFTGHYLLENEMGYAIQRGGAIMPHYRYQHVPGIDMLTEQTHENLTIKQCTSVANQCGRKWVLSETYGCTSWEFDFEGQKWVGDWQYALGVNLRCQHLALYSIRGCRKRDFPPAFSYQNTWWKHNAVVEDYFARVGRVTTAGQAVRDVLVLHPVSTGWTLLGESAASMARTNAYSEALNAFARALLATHYDWDFGDELIMADLARVEGDALIVGEATYRLVVVPPDMRTLLPGTLSLLEDLLEAGGTVLAVEPLPTMVAGAPDGRLAALWAHANALVIPDKAGLQAALEARLERRVSLRTPEGQEAAAVLAMQRRLEAGHAYFIVNTDRHSGYDLDVALQGAGRLEEWDPLTGAVRPLPAAERDGLLHFSARLEPAGSAIYVIDEAQPPLEWAPAPPREVLLFDRARPAQYLGPVCAYTRHDPNVLTLDVCSYRLGEGAWSAEMEVWRAQDAVRGALGMRPNYYNGLPQRYKWALAPHPQDGAPLELRFTFDADVVPSGGVYLLLEGSGWFRALRLNGQAVPNDVVGWYLDRAFHKIPLPGLRAGHNVLDLATAYTSGMELEDCFLLGDFGVGPSRHLIAEPARLRFGDWTSQGYLHYAGSITYHGALQYDPAAGPVRVYLGEHRATHVAVHVNGALAGHIPWQAANGLDVTAHLRPGHNDVGIEVLSSPRNMLGPLHLAAGREPWTDWRSFRRTDATFTPEYVVKAWGLFGQVEFRAGE
jgi:hypothetical protein